MTKKKSPKISRRTFLKGGTALGVSSLVGAGTFAPPSQLSAASAGQEIDIAVAEGKDYFKNTISAVEQLGGMKHFVPPNSRVAILANPQRNNPGAYTKPAVLAATIQMCKKAGAREVNCITLMREKNWQNTGLLSVVEKEGATMRYVDLKDESLFKKVPVPKGKSLKEALIMKAFFENDIFINLPITKDHAGNKFTGTLKNLMGLNGRASNRSFHKPGWKTDISSITHLDQCIADLNTIITPNLCIVDATEIIITNGPFGPGKLLKPQKVVAGVDRVAIDSYCCTLWGLNPGDIIMINKAHEHKLGQIDLKKVKIKSVKA
jgi:uncharacterized protein (DUF362 family)